MNPAALLETAALMGLLVLAGGGYGGLYGAGRLWSRPALVRAGQACWLLAFAIALLIAVRTPLDVGWKLLILASALVYAVIPPATWRFLQRLHGDEESRP
ncbi:MAG: hypothetical protein KF903_00790 [Dokdonella sp.]|uniref:hypothetical protein n=1 Tax=Dokdonella sp. TaxID=2291710 RepID=UPI0025BBC0A4|nr:hypothetical protein [Dokdonella sp.]MBX3699533.1 hypothetical protein [Dokdonella sp.]